MGLITVNFAHNAHKNCYAGKGGKEYSVKDKKSCSAKHKSCDKNHKKHRESF